LLSVKGNTQTHGVGEKLPHTTDIAPGPPQRWSKRCSLGVSLPVDRLLGAPKNSEHKSAIAC